MSGVKLNQGLQQLGLGKASEREGWVFHRQIIYLTILPCHSLNLPLSKHYLTELSHDTKASWFPLTLSQTHTLS